MKYFFRSALAVLAITFAAAAVNAGDKHESKDNLPSSPTSPATATLASTANEAVKPVVLLKPEAAFDDALSAPQKNVVSETDKELAKNSSGSKKAFNKMQPLAKQKSSEIQKKPSHHRKRYNKKRTRYKKKTVSSAPVAAESNEQQ